MALRQERQEQNRKAFSKLILPIAIFGIVSLVISFVVIIGILIAFVFLDYELVEYLVKRYHNQLSKSLVRWIDINQCHLFVGTRYRGGRLKPNSFTEIKVCHFSRGTVCCNSNWCQNVMHFKLVLVYNISQLDQFLPACRQPEREPRCQIGLFIIQCFLIFNPHCQNIKRFVLSSLRDNY